MFCCDDRHILYMNPSGAEQLPPRIHVLNSVAEVDKIISDYQIETRSAFIVRCGYMPGSRARSLID